MDKNKRIAIIGSGVSGTVAAWLLAPHAQVTLYEAEPRFGGHTHSYRVDEGTHELAVDTGFMVFNRPNYPLLSALFDHLGIASYPTNMSFSASFGNGDFEYAGTDLNSLFGQRSNLLSVRFWRLLREILRFNRVAEDALRAPPGAALALGDFLDGHAFSEDFRARYLYPMAAAIWSSPRGRIGDFPALSFLRFFANHGLIRTSGRPQWLTVEGGSSRYLDRLIGELGPRACAAAPVQRIERGAQQVTLHFADGSRPCFDEVVLACHSDQALRLLAEPDEDERRILAAIAYQPNRVLLHRDPALMPVCRRVWSSWNFHSASVGDAASPVGVTYWMNSLQRLDSRHDYFVSLNPQRAPRDETVIAEFEYQHPLFDRNALELQRRLHRIQGRSRTWFAGAWTGYGFHEDGMRSAVEVARALGATIPWAAEVEASQALTLVPQLVPRAA